MSGATRTSLRNVAYGILIGVAIMAVLVILGFA